MRRVLFVAYDFPPIATAAAQRARRLAQHLPSHGWHPVVVTPRAGASWAYDPSTESDLPPGLEVHRTASVEPSRLRLRRPRAGAPDGRRPRMAPVLREWALVPDPQVGWAPFAARAGLTAGRGAEVVLTTSPPASTHLVGCIITRLTRQPWVADLQDPWSLPAFQGWRGRFRPRLEARLERAVLSRADRVVATTDWLAEHAAVRGAGDRVRVVANGFEPGEYPHAALPDGAFTIVHTGSFYGPRSPEPLLAAVATAVSAEPRLRSALRVCLLGSQDAENEARLEGAALRYGLGGILERAGQVPRRQALTAMRAASILALVTDGAEGGRGLVPLKVYEYLGAGRPVLALCPPEGETGRLVRAAGGVVVDPSDTCGAAAALRRLYERWRDGDREASFNPSLVAAHRWDRLAGRLAAVLDEAIREGRR